MTFPDLYPVIGALLAGKHVSFTTRLTTKAYLTILQAVGPCSPFTHHVELRHAPLCGILGRMVGLLQ